MYAFQSSLELSPECNSLAAVGVGGDGGFNPHSSFRPSATPPGSLEGAGGLGVSILTRAFARVQLTYGLCRELGFCVSILTRAFARVQQSVLEKRSCAPCFNPHSSFRPSATNGPVNELIFAAMFQSSLELSPECNPLREAPQGGGLRVSILTRAFARVQPTLALRKKRKAKVSILTRAFARVQRGPLRSPRGLQSFQSSLELSPECNP